MTGTEPLPRPAGGPEAERKDEDEGQMDPAEQQETSLPRRSLVPAPAQTDLGASLELVSCWFLQEDR